MAAATINDIIRSLEHIIHDCRQHESRLGYFACLYQRMTVAIKTGIEAGAFEDGARMEKLDVIFANRYLDAYEKFAAGEKTSSCWHTAFNAAQDERLTVLQQLLLGINAHINLDLGIAASQAATAQSIAGMQRDFDKVNEIIAALFGIVQDSLSKISFPMIFIRKVKLKQTEAVLNFSMVKARQTAWANALLLSEAGHEAAPGIIETTDKLVCNVANGIVNPGKWPGLILRWARCTEHGTVSKHIDFLKG